MHSLWFFLLTVPKTNSIYTLSLHDALPIFIENSQDIKALADKVGETLGQFRGAHGLLLQRHGLYSWGNEDRKSTRLNSSHRCISYAVFCLKTKKFWKLGRVHVVSQVPEVCR